MHRKDALGARGEDAAASYLSDLGFEVLDRNWRCTEGELDIVARDGGVLVICEVKTRSGLRFGSPLEAVTTAKARRLRRLAGRWLTEHRTSRANFAGVRFDVVGVLALRDGDARIEHVRAVI